VLSMPAPGISSVVSTEQTRQRRDSESWIPSRIVRLTPAAAIVVTPAAAAIVVTPAAAAIVVTKATVVTVESVRVATPPRVPELAWAPLRERPGLGLGYARRSQTDEP